MGNKAFLIIDMQKGSFTDETPRHDASGVVARINQLATLCRKNEVVIVWIQHDGCHSGDFLPGTEEWELLDELHVDSDDLFISKTANDCFYGSKLSEALKQHGISDLWITGCATDFCVEATVQSAVAKDFNVTVVADGHTTAERKHASAALLIDHYNWTWNNMIPTAGELRVMMTAELLQAPMRS